MSDETSDSGRGNRSIKYVESTVTDPFDLSARSSASTAGLGAGSNVPHSVVARPSIELPKFKPGIDWMKFWMRRDISFNGILKTLILKPLTRLAPVTAMPMDSRPITKKVIAAVDDLMAGIDRTDQNWQKNAETTWLGRIKPNQPVQDNSVISNIRMLQKNILEALDSQQDISVIIQDFASKNARQLRIFSTEVAKLRVHVEDTYKTVDQLNDESTFYQLIGRHLPDTYVAGAYNQTGLTSGQKNSLIEFLSDLEKTALDLAKGVDGDNGKQMLAMAEQIQNHTLTTSQIRDSLSGLSHANYLADTAYSRTTGSWAHLSAPDKSPAYLQWRTSLERSIQDEDYNPEHYTKPVKFLPKENLEATWQNQLLKEYLRIGTKDDKGVINHVKWDGQNIQNFSAPLKEMFDAGYGHDAFNTIDDLMRRRQTWEMGENDAYTVPPADLLGSALRENPEYKTNPRYKRWVDAVEERTRIGHTERAGAARTTLPYIRYFQNNRQNQNFYAIKSYPYRFSRRYAYNSLLSVPGRNIWSNKLFYTPIKQIGAFITGAADIKTEFDFSGTNFKVGPGITWRRKDEGAGSQIRRTIVRWLSVGMFSDISFNPIRIPSKLGKIGLSAAAVWGVGLLMQIIPFVPAKVGGKGAELTGKAGVAVTTYPFRTAYNEASALWGGAAIHAPGWEPLLTTPEKFTPILAGLDANEPNNNVGRTATSRPTPTTLRSPDELKAEFNSIANENEKKLVNEFIKRYNGGNGEKASDLEQELYDSGYSPEDAKIIMKKAGIETGKKRKRSGITTTAPTGEMTTSGPAADPG